MAFPWAVNLAAQTTGFFCRVAGAGMKESVSVNGALGEELCVCVLVRCFIFISLSFSHPLKSLMYVTRQ